ncbi:hypothetical protein N2152v2_004996 [Parachlorella kessleri]
MSQGEPRHAERSDGDTPQVGQKRLRQSSTAGGPHFQRLKSVSGSCLQQEAKHGPGGTVLCTLPTQPAVQTQLLLDTVQRLLTQESRLAEDKVPPEVAPGPQQQPEPNSLPRRFGLRPYADAAAASQEGQPKKVAGLLQGADAVHSQSPPPCPEAGQDAPAQPAQQQVQLQQNQSAMLQQQPRLDAQLQSVLIVQLAEQLADDEVLAGQLLEALRAARHRREAAARRTSRSGGAGGGNRSQAGLPAVAAPAAAAAAIASLLPPRQAASTPQVRERRDTELGPSRGAFGDSSVSAGALPGSSHLQASICMPALAPTLHPPTAPAAAAAGSVGGAERAATGSVPPEAALLSQQQQRWRHKQPQELELRRPDGQQPDFQEQPQRSTSSHGLSLTHRLSTLSGSESRPGATTSVEELLRRRNLSLKADIALEQQHKADSTREHLQRATAGAGPATGAAAFGGGLNGVGGRPAEAAPAHGDAMVKQMLEAWLTARAAASEAAGAAGTARGPAAGLGPQRDPPWAPNLWDPASMAAQHPLGQALPAGQHPGPQEQQEGLLPRPQSQALLELLTAQARELSSRLDSVRSSGFALQLKHQQQEQQQQQPQEEGVGGEVPGLHYLQPAPLQPPPSLLEALQRQQQQQQQQELCIRQSGEEAAQLRVHYPQHQQQQMELGQPAEEGALPAAALLGQYPASSIAAALRLQQHLGLLRSAMQAPPHGHAGGGRDGLPTAAAPPHLLAQLRGMHQQAAEVAGPRLVPAGTGAVGPPTAGVHHARQGSGALGRPEGVGMWGA